MEFFLCTFFESGCQSVNKLRLNLKKLHDFVICFNTQCTQNDGNIQVGFKRVVMKVELSMFDNDDGS